MQKIWKFQILEGSGALRRGRVGTPFLGSENMKKTKNLYKFL